MLIKAGTSNISTMIRFLLSASGTPASQLVSDTAGLDMWYRRDGALKTLLSPINLVAVDSAHSDGGFIHIQDGYYRIDIPDAAVGSGAQGVMVGGSATNFTGVGTYLQLDAPVNIAKISGASIAADNLELQYDTTGLTGDTFPGTQAQLNNISSGTAAVNTVAESFTAAGAEPETNTYTATQQLDLTYHIVEDDATSTEFYYQFDVGSNGVPVSIQWEGYAQGINDTYTIKAYNWAGTSWDVVGSLAASVGTTRITQTYDLTTAHVGTSANAGKVRWQVTSANGDAFATDRILCSYAVVATSVGYANGSIWVDTNASNTNTTDYIDGVADNPVSTWAAALTINTSLGLNRFHVANGSTITLSGDSSNFTITGDNWTLVLNGQAITNAHFNGATVSGTGTGVGYDFHGCTIGDITVAAGDFFNCGLASDIVLSSAATYYFDQCFSGVAGIATPSIDFGASVADTNLNMRHYSGGIEIKRMGASANDLMSLEGWGQLKAASTCISGTVAIRGHFNITDNAGGAVTFSDPARYDVTRIRDEASGALNTYDGPTNAEMNARTILSAEYATSALIPSLSAGFMPATIQAIDGSASAAQRLRLSTLTMVPGAATAHQLSTTQMSNNLAETTDDHYIGRIILWTSGALKNQATDITDYTGNDGASALLTFTAVTEAPANTNTFIIL